MKNGLFATISSGKDGGAGYVNQLEQHQKLVFVEKRFCYQFGGIDKGIVYFELLPLNRTINSVVYIEQLTKLNKLKKSWKKAARIDKSKRCIPSSQCKATHIFGHSAKIIGAWLGCFATSTI